MALSRSVSIVNYYIKYQKSYKLQFPQWIRCKRVESLSNSNGKKYFRRENFDESKISTELANNLKKFTPVFVRKEIDSNRFTAIPLLPKFSSLNIVENSVLEAIREMPSAFQLTIFLSVCNFKNRKCTLEKPLTFTEVDKVTDDMLCLFGFNYSEFSKSILNDLPNPDWTIPAYEFEVRKNFDDVCIFTIDPPTAKDLDDAVHVIKLDDGGYQIGVHIADVSYFVKEGSLLDQEASLRSTSIYMANKVVPMLPSVLSENLCSLGPESKKLAVTCLITLNSEGSMVKHTFIRSVIQSCVRLSYTVADKLIDLSCEFDPNSLTEKHLENVSDIHVNRVPIEQMRKVVSSLKILNELSEKLRAKRVKEGALCLRKSELEFVFPEGAFGENNRKADSIQQNCYPLDFKVKHRGNSSFLIEELMLLANKAAAMSLVSAFYGTNSNLKKTKQFLTSRGSFLRRHPFPKQKKLDELKDVFKAIGLQLDSKDPVSLSKVLGELENQTNDNLSRSSRNAVYFMTHIRLQMALYFCLEHRASDMDYENLMEYSFHYGLGTPLYTHFTSPIRRYADLVVHRKLLEIHLALSKKERFKFPVSLAKLTSAAVIANEKRINAKRAKLLGDLVYLSALLKVKGPTNMLGNVIDIKDNGLLVVFGDIGITRFLHLGQKDTGKPYSFTKQNNEVKILWGPQDSCSHTLCLKISYLDSVPCCLHCHEEILDLLASPVRPLCPICNKDSEIDNNVMGTLDETNSNRIENTNADNQSLH